MNDTVPVCPAGPERVTALLDLWGCTHRPTQSWLAARMETLRAFRAAGRMGDAERYGWLTLAGVHTRMAPASLLALDPTAGGLDTRAGAHDTLPCPLLTPASAESTKIPATTLDAVDWRDPAAATLARAACIADRAAMVDFGDESYASAVFLEMLADRLATAREGDDA